MITTRIYYIDRYDAARPIPARVGFGVHCLECGNYNEITTEDFDLPVVSCGNCREPIGDLHQPMGWEES